MESASISICNQKGGVGKSSLTVLLASYLHYTLGHDVLVMDCDYPQWSVHAQRERELSVLENSQYYKLMLIRQFKATGRKLWPVIACTPAEAPERESRFLRDSDCSLRSSGYGQYGGCHRDILGSGLSFRSHEGGQGRYGQYALLCPNFRFVAGPK